MDLPQGGLEVPCTYKFLGEPKDVVNVWKLLAPSATNINTETQQPSKKRKVGPDVIDMEGIKLIPNFQRPGSPLDKSDEQKLTEILSS